MDKPVDMKMSKKEMKGMMPTVAGVGDGPKYPWGLQLRLDEVSIEKLGMKELPEVGALCQIMGVGRVTSVSQHESGSGKNRSVEIQIEKLNMHHEDEEEAFAKGARKGKTSARY